MTKTKPDINTAAELAAMTTCAAGQPSTAGFYLVRQCWQTGKKKPGLAGKPRPMTRFF